MARPLELCIEDLGIGEEQDRYVRCVALVGGTPGLALDREGVIHWMPEGEALTGLWVSADGRLVLLRGRGAAPITVERGGRRVDAPEGKPVILLDQDRLHAGGRELRVHLHGEALEIHPPLPVRGNALGRLARATAAALALGAIAGPAVPGEASPAQPPPIEIRDRPPDEAPVRRVDCTVTAMKAGKVLQVQATCPKGTTVQVGTTGQLIDPKTNAPLANGGVRITAVNGGAVTGEAAKLAKPVAAKLLRLMTF
jgi:hypothetical protein